MASLMKVVNGLIDGVDKTLDSAVENQYLLTTLKVFIALYAALAAPKLPSVVLRLLNFTIVRVLIAFVIIMVSMREPSIALLSAVAFIITLQYADQQSLWDTTLSQSDDGALTWLPSARNQVETSVPIELTGDEGQANSPSKTFTMSEGTDFPTEETKKPDVIPLEVQIAQTSNPAVEGYASFGIPSSVADPQNNTVPGVNQLDSVQTWMNQHNAQGFSTNSPMGYDGSHLSSF